MKSILNFLFGKMPDIFSEKGEVDQTRTHQSWSKWKRRYKESFEYNWKKHTGMRNQKNLHHSHKPHQPNKT